MKLLKVLEVAHEVLSQDQFSVTDSDRASQLAAAVNMVETTRLLLVEAVIRIGVIGPEAIQTLIHQGPEAESDPPVGDPVEDPISHLNDDELFEVFLEDLQPLVIRSINERKSQAHSARMKIRAFSQAIHLLSATYWAARIAQRIRWTAGVINDEESSAYLRTAAELFAHAVDVWFQTGGYPTELPAETAGLLSIADTPDPDGPILSELSLTPAGESLSTRELVLKLKAEIVLVCENRDLTGEE